MFKQAVNRVAPVRSTVLALGAGVILATSARSGGTPAFVWIEAEEAASINVPPNVAGWGHKEFLSGEKWLHYSIEADKVESTTPAEGILLHYAFKTAAAPECELWARLGFEFVRSPFDWRVDGGAWQTVGPDALTTDLMELDMWCEVAWHRLGKQALAAGGHTLDIRLSRVKDAKGKTAKVLFACDALCISAGPFVPNGRHKPGAEWQTARDRQAAAHAFKLPVPVKPGERGTLRLNGLWEICRNDEQTPPADIAQPMKDFPAQPFWSAIDVPGDRNTLRPDLLFAHRLWYRTRVEVPAALAGRSFILRFPQNNLNTTVFVNGTYCGFFKHPFAPFQIDITQGVKAGVNEVWVGIRDAWYGYSTSPSDPLKLRKKFNLPLSFKDKGFQDLAYPIWNHFQSGILQTPELIVAGAPVYASDVFVKPSVARKALEAEVTLANTSAKPVRGELRWQAVGEASGKPEKTFAPQPFELAAGEARTLNVSGVWENPKLWWPDEPNLYLLRVGVAVGDTVADQSDTRFGFREWEWSTRDFKLNGVVWHGWADCFTQPDKDAWLNFYKEKNQTVMRFWGTTWQGLPPEEALAFFDENGVVCRRSGIFDGEAIGYFAVEQDPELKKASPLKMDLLRNWREQMVAQVKGERNHPSVMLWSIENEFLFINCINLYGTLMDLFEEQVTETSKAVSKTDPTRPNMVDGGGATKAQTLPVHGDHYVAGKPAEYPPLAYAANPAGGGRGRWEWDQRRPRFLGEDFFMTGNHPEVAAFEGENAFSGKPVRGVALWNRILQEGYRWAGYGAWQFWLGQTDTDGSQYVSYAARAVFARDWNWTFATGQTVTRTFALFNDTRYADPISFTWALTLDGKKVAGRTQACKVAPGANLRVDEPLAIPAAKGRKEGELTLTLSVGGREVFRDVKAVSVLEPANRDMRGLDARRLIVFDPAGTTAAFLKARGLAHTAVSSLDQLPAEGVVLVIGKDALDDRESASSRLAAYAAAGRRVIVLEQARPLRYQAMPAEMEPSQNEGFIAFSEDSEHPALASLASKDFFTWTADRPVYSNAYEKPRRGARSLVQCDDRLRYTALAEVPVGKGLLLPCQLCLVDQLQANPVAQQLLLNLLGYAVSYQVEAYPVASVVSSAPQLKAALDAMGLRYTEAGDVMAALAQKPPATAIIHATPDNLKRLADSAAAVLAFTGQGGSLVLCGVTPEGLTDYNRLVGADHMMRPFRIERVTLPAVRDRLTAGLTAADVTLYSSKRIFPWTAGNYVASDMFSHVVDYDEVASFGTSPFGSYDKIVNGFVSADGWPLIINFPKNADDSPFDVPIAFQKPQTLTEFTWTGNVFYWPQTKVNLIFDGDRASMLSFDTPPNAEPQTFAIHPPRRASEVTLQIAAWLPVQGKAPNIGIDNISFKAQRSPEFYQTVKPMVNVGGLMDYIKGKGHIVLCNILFKEQEEVPENAAKKRAILMAVLRNLKAPFSEGRTVVAGMNLAYQPLDLAKHCTQYRDEKGWFGDKRFTFKDMPAGDQRLAGVRFTVYEMATSPVPNALMLGGKGVPGNLPGEIRGIAVGRKADALFFLHTARVDRRRSANDIKQGKAFELARYVVKYADGQTAEIPVLAEVDVENYVQKAPAVIPGAQVAWVRPYEGTDSSAVAYSKQWSNPRPDAVILSIDLLPGKDSAGVPAVLAITVAQGE